MTFKNALASVAVADLAAAKEWYRKLLGRPEDSMPMKEVAEWRFEGGGWLQVYQSKDRIGTGSVTLSVKDLGEQIAQLRKLGIDPGRQMSGDKVKVIMLKDPDGNSIALAQALDPTMAQ